MARLPLDGRSRVLLALLAVGVLGFLAGLAFDGRLTRSSLAVRDPATPPREPPVELARVEAAGAPGLRSAVTPPVAATPMETESPREVESAEPPAMSVEDAGGVTPKQREAFLKNGHEHLLRVAGDSRSKPYQVAQVQKGLLRRCVATLLYARGRVAFASQLTEEEKKWYSTNEPSFAEGRTIIGQDRALFEFSKGEFPEFDRAMELLNASVVDEEAMALTESLFEHALATFEPMRGQGRER